MTDKEKNILKSRFQQRWGQAICIQQWAKEDKNGWTKEKAKEFTDIACGYMYAVGDVLEAYNKNHEDSPLPKIRAHDLRHTAATLLLEADVDIKYVSRQLRHSSTVITQNLYQHVTRRAASKTADVMDALVNSNI